MLLGSIFWHVTRLAVTRAFYYFQTSQPKQGTNDIASTGRMSSSTKTHSIFKRKKNTQLYTKDIAYYKNSMEGWLDGGPAVWRQPESTVWSSLGQERVWWVRGGCGDVQGAETVLVSKARLCSQGWRALLDKVQALRAGSPQLLHHTEKKGQWTKKCLFHRWLWRSGGRDLATVSRHRASEKATGIFTVSETLWNYSKAISWGTCPPIHDSVSCFNDRKGIGKRLFFFK